jgi:hypothetical protein
MRIQIPVEFILNPNKDNDRSTRPVAASFFPFHRTLSQVATPFTSRIAFRVGAKESEGRYHERTHSNVRPRSGNEHRPNGAIPCQQRQP